MIAPHFAALHESHAAYERWGRERTEAVTRIWKGLDPISQLGPEASLDLDLHRTAMHGALRATHAQFARAPASLRVFAFFDPGEPFLDVQQAAWLAALDMLTLLEQGHADAAAEECADVLAFGRDLSFPSVMGRMFGVGITGISAHACGRALASASPATVDRVRAELFAIRRGTPRYSDILRREWLFQQLWLGDADPRLPEGARVFIAGRQYPGRSALEGVEVALFGTTALDRLAARMAAFLEAQRLDWPVCSEQMEEVTRRFEWNPLLWESSFVSLLRRHRDALLKLDALTCAASAAMEQARTGVLPHDARSTCPPIEPAATCGEQGAPMRIVDDGQTPHVAVTLSNGSEFVVPLARAPQGSAAVLR